VTAIAGDADPLQRADDALASGDLDGAIVQLSAAIRARTAQGEHRTAAMVCIRLGDLYAYGLGSKVAARPWYTRAIRLLEDEDPCVEQGWAAIGPLGCDIDDPADLITRAELALDRARRFGDVALEIKALADGGLAHAQAGQLTEGMVMIDEAMALACSGATGDLDVLGKSVCSFFTACYYTADFERVESWTRTLRQRGLLEDIPGPQAFLSSHCDSVQATLLCHLGRWGEAEQVLLRAQDTIEELMPGTAWYPPIALAELRILQGRLTEAEALLLGRDDHILALLPTARLHLARGDHDLACATAHRGLRMIGDDRIRAATLLGILVEAELGRGNLSDAAEIAAQLDARLGELHLPALAAQAARVQAKVRVAQGEEHAAAAVLHEALEKLSNLDLPLMKMGLHIDLARLYDSLGDHPGAVVEARSAAALLARLDVVVAPADVRLLNRLGVEIAGAEIAPGRAPAGRRVATLQRDGAWWTAADGDTRVRLRHTKGMAYLADLMARPGIERHVLDLVDLVEGVLPTGHGADRRQLGDAGDLLDPSSRSAYRRRVEELRDEVEDALALEDDDRAARAQTELDALVAELSRAFGLGGRSRRAASAAEKARLNVTRALRAATARLAESLPGAGDVLDRQVRTGLFCAYEPHPDDGTVWNVQS
jgi:tetratricopeptide (TPR) repeat protein